MKSLLQVYQDPMHELLQDLPPGTKWWEREEGGFLHWEARRDAYHLILTTPGRSVAALWPPDHETRTLYSQETLGYHEIGHRGTSDFEVSLALARKIKCAIQRHYFLCAHARGGYC